MTDFAAITTMRVGGPIRTLREPGSLLELRDALASAHASDEPWIVLGGGSNVVAPDEPYDGTVVRTTGMRGIAEVAGDPAAGVVRLDIAAGERWDDVVAWAVARGLAGIEALSGVPGTAGAAPVQNIGAYGQELASVLESIDLLDPATGTIERIDAGRLGLGYRTSAIKRGELEGVIVAIRIALRPDAVGAVAYPQLADALGVPVGATAPLATIRDRVLALRAAKGVLDDGGLPSCGSFFVNPVVDENWARSLPTEAPRWPVDPEEADLVAPLAEGPRLRAYPQRRDVKLSAAWLIEHAGIQRGWGLPGSGARVSPRHTLAIVNAGGATARDVLQLAGFIQSRVSADFGVTLRPEPVILVAPQD